jgi:hypothetical protein
MLLFDKDGMRSYFKTKITGNCDLWKRVGTDAKKREQSFLRGNSLKPIRFLNFMQHPGDPSLFGGARFVYFRQCST